MDMVMLRKSKGNQSIFGALGLQHVDTIPKDPPPRPKFKRTSKPTEKLSMLIKEQELKKSKEESNKIKKTKLWKKTFRFQRDGKPYVTYRCGWCNCVLSKDAQECPNCTSDKKSGSPGTRRRSAKLAIKKEDTSSMKGQAAVKGTRKVSTQLDKGKPVKPERKVNSSSTSSNKGQRKATPTKSTVKRVQESSKLHSKGPQKRKGKVEVIQFTKQTGHVIKVYRCSKCSAFLSRDNKKCTKCIQRLQKLLETRQMKASIKNLATGAKTKKQVSMVKPRKQTMIKKEPTQKSCKICKKRIRKADEDYCYTCRGHSKYKGVVELMRARAGEKNAKEVAGPSTGVETVVKSEDTPGPSTSTTSNVLKSIHDNNQGVEISTDDLTENDFIEIVDEDDDEEACYITLSEIEVIDD